MFMKLVRESDRPLIGAFAKISTLEVIEIVATTGFDFVVIDTEHAPLSTRDVYSMIVAYSSMGVAPLVRITDHGYGEAQRYLDGGAAGIVVPHVDNASQATEVFSHLQFPPDGSRGMGVSSRAGLWGAIDGGLSEYLRVGREDVARVAMVEDDSAVDGASDIAAVPGLNAIFVGPADMSLSLGLPIDSPEVNDRVTSAIRKGVAAGVEVGTAVQGFDAIQERLALGCSFVTVGNDAVMILDGASRSARQAKDAVAAFLAAR